MRTAILTVGTEILFGQVVNTNAAYLSQELNHMGYDVMYHYTVGDNPERLLETIELAFRDCDLILTTGGLGPTQDDLTKEVICQAMDDYLVVNETCLADLKAYMMKMNRTITENNYKQANMPSRAVVLPNDAGTAPGFLLEKDGKRIIAMPGPPREMTRMFEKQVKPILAAHQDSVISYRILRAFGLGESRMETELLPLINVQTDPTIATYAKEGECSLRIASKRATQQEAEAAVDDMIEKVDALIGDYIYSHDNEELVQVVGRLLLEKNITISCCESCTGGLFAGALTQVPGISDVFNRGIVTYTNQAKVDELGVSADTIENYGAVSQETAAEMASGLYRITGSDICISITGVAGPEPSEGKPVGLVYIGMTWQGATTVQKVQMRNVNREWNRHYAVLSMLHEVYRRIIM
ncbi:MAG: competence/damage-inducible protein A [Firmicutes bacterium]|nr:competence/damage-inducible protein A [Bacillota bacterium]